MAGVLPASGRGQARQSCRRQRHIDAALTPAWLETLPEQISRLVAEASAQLHQQGDDLQLISSLGVTTLLNVDLGGFSAIDHIVAL